MRPSLLFYFAGLTFISDYLHAAQTSIWIKKDNLTFCVILRGGEPDLKQQVDPNQCEKDTQWLKTPNGKSCYPVSIVHKLDLTAYQDKLVQLPNDCVRPQSLRRHVSCVGSTHKALNNEPNIPDLDKVIKQLSADAGPHEGKIQLLGKGATKKVYLARLKSKPEQLVAAYDYVSSDPHASRLDYEIHLIDRLFLGKNPMNPSGIVIPLGTHRRPDGDQVKTTRYMEVMSGKSMETYMPKAGQKPSEIHHFKLSEALQMTRDVCKTLQALHDRKVVHRDIKPANLFYDGHNVKIGDFDIAYSLDDNFLELPHFDQASSTAPYLSPESVILGGNKVEVKPSHTLEEAKKELFDIHTRADDWAGATTLLNVFAQNFAPWQTMQDPLGKPNPWGRVVYVIGEYYEDPTRRPAITEYIEKTLDALANSESEKKSLDKLKDFFSCALKVDRRDSPCDIKTKCDAL